MGSRRNYKSFDYDFGLLVQKYRHKADLTQTQLAAQLGVSKRTIVNWEGGNGYPQNDHLRGLIEILLGKGVFPEGQEESATRYFWDKATPSKMDVKDAFNLDWFESLLDNNPAHKDKTPLINTRPRLDWREVPENPQLYGRNTEQAELLGWLKNADLKVVCLAGLGGIGKTTLAANVGYKLYQDQEYACVIFRTLGNAPPFEDFVTGLLNYLFEHQLIKLPFSLSERYSLLLDYLIDNRCLLIIDNLETLLQPGLEAGSFHHEYARYEEFIRRLIEIKHKSCLLITSREIPLVMNLPTGRNQTRVLNLTGLDPKACQMILNDGKVSANDRELARLIDRYGGNPLALRLSVELIRKFGGNAENLLAGKGEDLIYDGLQRILIQHMARISAVEEAILYWLAIGRAPLKLSELGELCQLEITCQTLVDGVNALLGRGLIELVGDSQVPGFTLQGVILEFITGRFLHLLYTEIIQQNPRLLTRYPLMQTRVKAYIRLAQRRVLVTPLREAIQVSLGDRQRINLHLQSLLEVLRALPKQSQGYAGGNILNLLTEYNSDLRGWNLTGLNLRESQLRGVELTHLTMQGSDLSDSNFTEAYIDAYCLAYASTEIGDLLALGCSNGSIKIWQAAMLFGPQLYELAGHQDLIRAVTFNSEGTLLASASSDGSVRLWELVNGTCVAILRPPANLIFSLAFSPEGDLLAAGCHDQNIYLWQVATLRLVNTLETNQGWIMSLAFSPDGKHLASGGFDTTVKMWDISSPTEHLTLSATLRGHRDWVGGVAFSPDGRYFASASTDATIYFWNLPGKTLKDILLGHTGSISGLVFSPDSKWLASGSTDTTVRLWDVINPANQKSLVAGAAAVTALGFSPCGERLVTSCGEISSVKIWSVRDLEELDHLQGYSNTIYTLELSPNNKWLAGSGSNFKLLLWDLTGGLVSEPFVITGHTGLICSLAFSPDSTLLASGSGDYTIRIRKLNHSARVMRTLTGHKSTVMGLTFLVAQPLLVSCDEQGELKLWSVINGTCLDTLVAHKSRIRCLITSQGGKYLATGGDDGYIHLWEIDLQLSKLRSVASWYCPGTQIMGLAFNKAATRLFSCGSDGSICSWQTQPGATEVVYRHRAHNGSIRALAIRPDGCKLASAGDDGILKIWEVGPDDVLRTVQEFEHGAGVMTLVFTPDNTRIFSAGTGGLIKLWDLAQNALETIIPAYRPYNDLDITGVEGLTAAQRLNLLKLGAIEAGPASSLT